MKSVIAGLFIVVSSLGHAQAAPSVYGQWSMPGYQGNGIVIAIHLVFEANQATAIAECSGFGQSVVSKASAPATYTSNTIAITQSAQHTEYAGSLKCDASLDVGTVGYQVSQNSQMLVLTASGNSITLTREK